MQDTRKLDLTWLGLVALSLAGAVLGGTQEPGLAATVFIALVMAIKVKLVCDHYLELSRAHPRIRLALQAFCYGMPLLVIVTSLTGPLIARLSSALI